MKDDYSVTDCVNAFCEAMNKKAKSIGMNNSCFVDPAGCRNSSTARDMLYCLANLYKYDVMLDIMTKQKYTFLSEDETAREITVESKTLVGVGTDYLTGYYKVLCGKGGTLTYQKQYNSAVIVDSPDGKGRLGCVVMGAYETNDLPNNRFAADKQALDCALNGGEGDVCAKCAIVCRLPECKDGKIEILYEKNADEVAPPASMSKMLTAQVFLDHTDDLREYITITSEMIEVVPKGFYQRYLKVGDRIKLIDVMHALMLASSNAAGFILAYHAGKRMLEAQV